MFVIICPHAHLVKGTVHQVHKSNTEGSEEIEEFADEVPASAYNIHGNEKLAEVELLREDLLNVLIALDRESTVGHHEVHAQAARVVEHILGESADVPLLEHISVSLHPTFAVVGVETFRGAGKEVVELERTINRNRICNLRSM